MNIEDLCLNIEQCKHLLELGLDMSNSAFCWTKGVGTYSNTVYEDWLITTRQRIEELKPFYFYIETIPTYTLQEIIEILPNWEVSHLGNVEIRSQLTFKVTEGFSYVCKSPIVVINQLHRRPKALLEEYDYNPLNDAYKMLCWCIENDKMKGINKIWKPKKGEKYYTIDRDLNYSKFNTKVSPVELFWDDMEFEKKKLINGLVFKTLEECQKKCDEINESIIN